jgi:hypothetical protein
MVDIDAEHIVGLHRPGPNSADSLAADRLLRYFPQPRAEPRQDPDFKPFIYQRHSATARTAPARGSL